MAQLLLPRLGVAGRCSVQGEFGPFDITARTVEEGFKFSISVRQLALSSVSSLSLYVTMSSSLISFFILMYLTFGHAAAADAPRIGAGHDLVTGLQRSFERYCR